MPDLLGHAACARVVRAVPWVARVTEPPLARAAYYVGALWPDLVTRPFHILWPWSLPYVEGWHNPLLQPLWAVMLAALCVDRLRWGVFRALLIGMATHIAIDRVQYHFVGGYLFWFPLSSERTTGGLVWPEESLIYVTPPLVALALLAELCQRGTRGTPDRATLAR